MLSNRALDGPHICQESLDLVGDAQVALQLGRIRPRSVSYKNPNFLRADLAPTWHLELLFQKEYSKDTLACLPRHMWLWRSGLCRVYVVLSRALHGFLDISPRKLSLEEAKNACVPLMRPPDGCMLAGMRVARVHRVRGQWLSDTTDIGRHGAQPNEFGARSSCPSFYTGS